MADFDVDFAPLRELLLGRSLNQMSNDPMRTTIRQPMRIGALSVGPASTLELQVLNAADDKDGDGVFGAKHHIAYDAQRAWLKYKLHAKADAKIAGKPLNTALGQEMALCDYRIHDATESALVAVDRDLATPRSALSLEDVLALAPGEALSVERGGRFTASVTLSWADVISTRMSDLIANFDPASAIVVRLKRDLETAVTVRVDDHYSVVLSRTAEGGFRCTVRRAASRTHRFSVDAAAGVELSVVKAIEDAMAPLFEALTGVALDAAERAAAAGGVEPRGSEEQDVLDRLARYFGVDTREERERRVREAFDALKKDLRTRLQRAAAWKAVAEFSYEYERLDEETALADFVIHDPAVLAHDHALVVEGDFARLRHALRRNPQQRVLLDYLDERARERSSASGFSLSFGRWEGLSAQEKRRFRVEARTSLDGFHLVTAKATHAYQEKGIPQNDFEWAVDFQGAMREYAERPDTSLFAFRLQYVVQFERSRLREDDLERMLDFAAMWGVPIPEPSSLAAALGKAAALKVQILFDHAALEAALSGTVEDRRVWSGPLAAAMPWASNFEERRSHERRRAVYEDAWLRWLDEDDDAAHAALASRIRSGLRLLEARRLPGSFAWASGEGHPQLRRRLALFTSACGRLFGAMNDTRPPEELEDIVAGLEQLWSQRLYVAASGRYLLDRAEQAGARVRRSLRIDVDDEAIVS